MGIREDAFTCRRNGLTIRGMQYLPNEFVEDKKYPAMIVSHGFTDNYTGVASYCRAFAKMGYISFGFNFCGGGKKEDDIGLKSDGASTDMTIFTEVEDLITVKEYVKRLPYIQKEELILAGVSQGGFVSGLAAAKCGEEISKLIMISPALCIPDHAGRGCLGGSCYDPNNVPPQIDCGKTILGRAFHDQVVGMDPFREIAPYKGPVLILHGLEDEVVNYSYAVRAKESYEKGQCALQLIQNAGHSFLGQHEKIALASIGSFLMEGGRENMYFPCNSFEVCYKRK